MSANHNSGTILIKQGTLLPPGLVIETESFLPGWRIVKNPDRNAFARKIENAHWNFFFLAGSLKATVIGGDGPAVLRRAVKRALAKRRGQELNSLEITRIFSRRFLVIPFLTITAHARHIQQGTSLVPTRDFVLRMQVAAPSEKPAAKNFAELSSGS